MRRLTFLFFALPLAVGADPLIHDESIDGDIQGQEFEFGFGANTLSGTVSCGPRKCDFDKFYAFLPEFATLDSITLIQADANGSGRFPGMFEASAEPFRIDLTDGYRGQGGEFTWEYGKLTTFLYWVGHNGFPGGMEVDYTLVFDVSPTTVPGALAAVGDIDGDGIQDLAALLKDAGTLNAMVKDTVDRQRTSKVRFDPDPVPLDIEVMADINGNGAPELVVLGQDVRASRDVSVEVRDSLSGERLGFVDPYLYGGSPRDLELVRDQTGNGIPEVAVLTGGSYNYPRVTVIDPSRRNTIKTLTFNSLEAKDLSVWLIGKSTAVGVLAESKYSTRSDRIEIRDLNTGNVINNVYVGKPWNLLQMELLADLNGNGSPEAVILREHPDDNRVSVLPVDTANGARFRHLGFDPNYRPIRLRVVDDLNGNGSEEVAVLAVRRDCCNQKVWVKDTLTGESIRIVYFGKKFIGEDMAISPDINGNGTPELVVLGQRDDGVLRAIIKDSKTGEFISSIGF